MAGQAKQYCPYCKLERELDDEVTCPNCGNYMLLRSNKRYTCPECNSLNVFHKEIHPDTDMNKVVLCCKDCGYEGA